MGGGWVNMGVLLMWKWRLGTYILLTTERVNLSVQGCMNEFGASRVVAYRMTMVSRSADVHTGPFLNIHF